jgi:AcrR family transcriptional regulator
VTAPTTARLSRSERKAATREALVDAGHAVFLRDGFHGASLDRVAAEAGFTKGAVYAHFATKADLFLAILERRVDQRVVAQETAGEGARDFEAMVDQATEQWGTVMREDAAWTLLLLEFWVHAARDPELRARVAEQHRRTHDSIARLLGDVRNRSGQDLGLPDDDVATVLMALGNGLNLDGLLFSGAPRVDLYERTLTAMLAGLR